MFSLEIRIVQGSGRNLEGSGDGAEGFGVWRGRRSAATDLAGAPYYTIVLETTFNSAADWEKAHLAARDNTKWKALYAKIVPLTETDHREILSVIG
jgi:hypothetical protein